MDKNEIIDRLERLARCAIHTEGELPFVMSLDDGIAIHEAIDMLRQSQPEPTTHGSIYVEMTEKQGDRTTDGLISRKAAIDAIEEYADRLQIVDWKENPGVPYKAYALNWCINTIRDLPSSQPDLEEAYICGETEAEARYHAERKKGRWIPQDHNKTNGMMSTLVYYYPKCSVCGHCANYTNFCPNCGARMGGE